MISKIEFGIITVKMKRTWLNKKEPTNPKKKEQHEIRKYKRVYLSEIREKEQQQEIRDALNASKQV